ncbi:multiheme c-type cytochrome [Pirellulales bacterium]|nr:multiheme c-type cytochrome [Pirellulales bacterium]
MSKNPDNTPGRIDAVAEWRSTLTAIVCSTLLFEIVTGLVIYIFPFGEFTQFSVLLHTLVGFLMLGPATWYLVRHWLVRRGGNLSHIQLLGYSSLVALVVCTISGFVVTWQGAVGPAMSSVWDAAHLASGLAFLLLIVVHLWVLVIRKVNQPEALLALQQARRAFFSRVTIGCALLMAACGVWTLNYDGPKFDASFSDSYIWDFGEDRPFAPSLAQVDQQSWREQVRRQAVNVLTDRQRSIFLAALSETEDSPMGLCEQFRKSADASELDDEQRVKIDRVLDAAADHIKERGAIDPRLLSGSAGCGTAGCHEQIYEEWLPSAHRYSAMDEMFQRVQELMAVETSPEHTRYCAGCHDPISLFSGAKNASNITLSAAGADEGSSCLVCHSISKTDIQGNANYTIEVPQRYVYEMTKGPVAKFLSDFLIRTYPQHHVASYSRPLYKTAEFCAACHKQYIDKEVNTDIGKVQGQNQYDSWKNSRWYHENNPEKSISCRECHMPLEDSIDPARGDLTDYNRNQRDGKHRGHRMLASNQYVPLLMDLRGAKKHTKLIEEWLQGKIEIPEIADKWTSGPVVRMDILAPSEVRPGETVDLRVLLTNNKTGHDFPTGPLDMIESWVELKVCSPDRTILYHSGAVDEAGHIAEPTMIYKADGFDRQGKLIDRHNLWDLVGANYKRSLFPGATDAVQVKFQCPSMARGRLTTEQKRVPGGRSDEFAVPIPPNSAGQKLEVTAVLWYRKANPEFLDRVYGAGTKMRSPITELSHATASVKVIDGNGQKPTQ